jgi:DNA mismatch endonuclease (patch repair protein)
MSAVRSKNTGLELKLLSMLHSANITGFTCHDESLLGTPDIAFKKAKAVVFLDSCFWHACPKHFRQPRTNTKYWQAKIEKNLERDRSQRRMLRRSGWRVIRVWEHELKNRALVLRKVRQALESQLI